MDSAPSETDLVGYEIDSDQEELPPGYFELTPGFLAFVGVMLLPAIMALVVFIGGAFVTGGAPTADAQNASPGVSGSASLNQGKSIFWTCSIFADGIIRPPKPGSYRVP
jgi:hypothetical protein